MEIMYEFLSESNNVIGFDLTKMIWVKSNYPANSITVHFGKDYDDLNVNTKDFPTAQALVDDISKKKNNIFKISED